MNQSHSMRADIQALRGLAALLVFVYLTRVGLFHADFMGVVTFIAISGFLITSMTQSRIERAKFIFKIFCFRRAKRLLPAAYTIIFVTPILAFSLLTGIQAKQYAQPAAGAISFSADYILMPQGSYFGGAAKLEPLNMWVNEESFHTRLVLATVSIALVCTQYHFIEQTHMGQLIADKGANRTPL